MTNADFAWQGQGWDSRSRCDYKKWHDTQNWCKIYPLQTINISSVLSVLTVIKFYF